MGLIGTRGAKSDDSTVVVNRELLARAQRARGGADTGRGRRQRQAVPLLAP
jgi:hypothetical protein